MGFLILCVVVWASVGGGVGAAIGNSKGRGPAGFWLGFFFGGIGWIIVAVMQATPEAEVARMAAINTLRGGVTFANTAGASSTRVCPHCAETIKSAAVVCRFCGNAVEPIASVASIESSEEQIAMKKLRDTFALLEFEEFPRQFNDAFWEAALTFDPWPTRPLPFLRRALQDMKRGTPTNEALKMSYFLAAQREPPVIQKPSSPTTRALPKNKDTNPVRHCSSAHEARGDQKFCVQCGEQLT